MLLLLLCAFSSVVLSMLVLEGAWLALWLFVLSHLRLREAAALPGAGGRFTAAVSLTLWRFVVWLSMAAVEQTLRARGDEASSWVLWPLWIVPAFLGWWSLMGLQGWRWLDAGLASFAMTMVATATGWCAVSLFWHLWG